MVTFHMLGPFEMREASGQRISFRRRKQRALLVLRSRRSTSAQELVNALWERQPQLCAALADELGVRPAAALQSLYDQMRDGGRDGSCGASNSDSLVPDESWRWRGSAMTVAHAGVFVGDPVRRVVEEPVPVRAPDHRSQVSPGAGCRAGTGSPPDLDRRSSPNRPPPGR